MLERLVAVSEMWNHYAAAVAHAKIPIETVPLPRAPRIAGQSKMNLISLVTHGLGAISVLGDVIGVRLLIWTVGVAALVLLGMAGVAVASNFVQLAVPGWAASSLGWLLVTLLNLTLISMGLALFVLHSRSYNAVIPLRDYVHFVLGERVLWPAAAPDAARSPAET
jgi:hypothetical protein